MRVWAVLILVCFAVLATGCSENNQLSTVQGYAQGTTYTISYWSEAGVPPESVKARAESILAKIDAELSNYREDSAIEAFNRAQRTEPQEVPESLVALMRIAADVNAKSSGCYDLTIRPLFALWGFSAEFRVPAEKEVAAVLAGIGMDKLTAIGDRKLAKAVPGLAVDVSSIAQGYSTAKLAEALDQLEIKDYLVEVGGELLVQGQKPDGEPWRVAIERPLAGERAIQKIVEIKPGDALSVVTSGTYRHYYDKDGKRYSHILDARTGAPVTHELLSVTVIHPDPTVADAWSTALLCLGPDAALEVAEAEDMAVMLIEAEGEGWRETVSPAFENDRWQVRDVSE